MSMSYSRVYNVPSRVGAETDGLACVVSYRRQRSILAKCKCNVGDTTRGCVHMPAGRHNKDSL